MKYIGYWEFDLEDIDEVFELNDKLGKAVEAKPDDFPDVVLGAHSIAGSSKGFTIFETDDPDKLLKISLSFTPIVKFKFIPLYPVKTIQKYYSQVRPRR